MILALFGSFTFIKEALSIFTNHAVIISTVIALCALVYTGLAIKEDIKTRQIQLLESGFKRINDSELLFYTKYKNANHNTRKEWDSIFFNSIEFYSFLINKTYINEKDAIEFFGEAIVGWYDEIFRKHASTDELKNPKIYPEMKVFYAKMKSPKNK